MKDVLKLKLGLAAPVAIIPPGWVRFIAVGLLGGVAIWLVIAFAPAAAPIRRATIGSVFLLNVFSSYLSDSRFEIASLFTPDPAIDERLVSFGDERLRLTFFRPGEDQVRAGILLVNGAVELGNDEPAIRRVARSLARVGFLVAIPELVSQRESRIDPDDPARLGAAFQAVRAESTLQDTPAGIVGLCFGASLGIVAASDASIADQVAFVAGAIPYARLDTLLLDVLSHSSVSDNGIRTWVPREDVQAKLPLALIGLLPDEADREPLFRILKAGLLEHGHTDLSPSGDALRRLLVARDRGEAEAILAQQDPALLAALDRLSPLPRLDGLRAPLFLFHSEGDRVMPWEHAAALAEAAPAGGRLEVSGLLQHTRLILDPREWRLMLTYPREAWQLMVLLNDVLEAAGVA